MRNRTFHKAAIGGFKFDGVLSADGPYIDASAITGGYPEGGMALVVSGLRRFLPPRFRMGPAPWGWYIVKYEDQARVFLDGFTQAQVDRLRVEFGLLPVGEQTSPNSSAAAFYCSRDWVGLVQWVDRHPRIAQRTSQFDACLPGWHLKALKVLGKSVPKPVATKT